MPVRKNRQTGEPDAPDPSRLSRHALSAHAPHAALRDLTQENTLTVKDLIWPLFLCEGAGV
jgi:delta-aminolevulinic acid dehydratase/porphobilinogen synthase